MPGSSSKSEYCIELIAEGYHNQVFKPKYRRSVLFIFLPMSLAKIRSIGVILITLSLGGTG